MYYFLRELAVFVGKRDAMEAGSPGAGNVSIPCWICSNPVPTVKNAENTLHLALPCAVIAGPSRRDLILPGR